MAIYLKKYKKSKSGKSYTFPEIIEKNYDLDLVLKECARCKTYNNLRKYRKRNKAMDGHDKYCNECNNYYYILYKENNKAKLSTYHKEYQKKYNKTDKHIAWLKAYRELNKEDIAKKRADYYLKNIDTIKEKAKEYRKNNKEKIDTRIKKWNEENKERVKEVRNAKIKRRYANDEEFKIRHILNSSIRKHLKKQKISKKSSGLEIIIGCTFNDLKKHIEKQFQDGMNWDNHGQFGWHIDHIKPVSKFDLRNKANQMKAYNFKNLQPLWWKDNIKKSNK
tara:strand:+ start:502 stop:1335 length:834 start_codon:yes stop_codon:yes gene_type:complete